jgi:hypothetical protein
MKKIYSWIIDKWLAGFITASFFFLVKLYLELPADSKSNFFSFEWLEIFNLQIRLYYVIFIISFIIIITRFEKLIYTSKKITTSNHPPRTHFENYKNDIFGKAKSKWSWDYKWLNYKQSFDIVELKPNCPVCDIPMNLDDDSYQSADCYKCRLDGKNYHFRVQEHIGDIFNEIVRKIDNDEIPI